MGKYILVATIGTRDLAFQLPNADWRNVGDKQVKGNNKSDMTLVQEDIGLENSSLRELTKHYVESWDKYNDRFLPIIIGGLIRDKQDELAKIYLIGTDQKESINFRTEDTLYSAQIIEQWIKRNTSIPVEVILQGQEGYNPSNFEEMFQWWKETWRKITLDSGEDIKVLLCLKGGVGQSAEASRITALTKFAENAIFYDFFLDRERNLRGEPSLYGEPTLGINYLWDRRQKEALALLNRFDYDAVSSVLKPYYSLGLEIEQLLESARLWNNCKFDEFANLLDKKYQERSQHWWWTAYEASYLAIIRHQQGNIVEAFFHSFRAFEGAFFEWGKSEFGSHISEVAQDNCITPYLVGSIVNDKSQYFSSAKFKTNGEPRNDLAKLQKKLEDGDIILDLGNLCKFFRTLNPDYETKCERLKMFWQAGIKITDRRNFMFHQLQGMSEQQLWEFWEVKDQLEWQGQTLDFLNFITKQAFNNLPDASLMSKVHREIEHKITNFELKLKN